MDLGRKITDLEKMENVPEGTSYLAEAGDGSGTKQIEHKKLVETISKDINLGNLKDLDTNSKKSVVEAINEVNEKAETAFTGTDGIKAGTSGRVPAPKPEEAGHVLGANGKWVPAGEGGSLASKIIDDREELEANTEKGMLVDALVVKDLNDSLKFPDGTQFYADIKDGKPGFNTDPERGADTFVPFRSSLKAWYITGTGGGSNSWTFDIKSKCEEWADIIINSDQWTLLAATSEVYAPTGATLMRSVLGTYNNSTGLITFPNSQNNTVNVRVLIVKWY